MNRIALSLTLALTPLLGVTLLPGAQEARASGTMGLYRAQTCSTVRSRLIDLLTDQALRQRPYYYRHNRRHHMGRRGRGPMADGLARDRLQSAPTRKSSRAPAAAAEAAKPSAPTRSTGSIGAASGGGAPSGGPSHFTGTNNQVDGVDEADQVKTDGRHIYTLFGREVLVLKSWPVSATSIIGRYQVKSGFTPRSLFLRGNQLMVLSNGYRRRNAQHRHSWWASRSARHTRITLLDISQREQPKRLAAVELEGNMLQARLIGANAFVVSNDPITLPYGFWQRVWQQQIPSVAQPGFRPWGAPPPEAPTRYTVRARIKRALSGITVQQLLPSMTFYDGGERQLAVRPLHQCGDLYIPHGAARLGLLSLTQLSFSGGQVNTAGIMAGGQRIYASTKNLYVSTTAYRWHWSRNWGYNGTQIHKFALPGGKPRYAASGVVPGYLLNQFSMDEHRGFLRVATTQNGWGWRRGQSAGNNLFVLAQSGTQLAVRGQVRGLAPGERIYAARMMGDKGYVVTFRRTDPLYTMDLSDPSNPRVVGELKINGFSSYIHPLSPGLLLTVGQDADERGRVRGAHLQIFDVSDLRQPVRKHHYLLTEGFRSSSTAQYDHHAFTFDSRSGTLALPLSVQSAKRWTGIALVHVGATKGFRYIGTIDHADFGMPNGWASSCPPGARCRPRRWASRWIPINRSLFIDRFVFSLSSIGLKAHDLGQGSPKQVVALRFDQAVRQAPVERGTRPWH